MVECHRKGGGSPSNKVFDDSFAKKIFDQSVDKVYAPTILTTLCSLSIVVRTLGTSSGTSERVVGKPIRHIQRSNLSHVRSGQYFM